MTDWVHFLLIIEVQDIGLRYAIVDDDDDDDDDAGGRK
jgi:hypothetical protein